MSVLALRGVVDERLGPLSLEFAPGVSCVLGADSAVLARLAEISVGLRRPQRGSANLDSVSVFTSPTARAEIASSLRDEALPPARDVEEALALCFDLRRLELSARGALERIGLERLLGVHPSSLGSRELRAVTFAVALAASERAKAVVLFDPFALSPLIAPLTIVETCERLARERPVVVLGVELAEAMRLGGRCLLIEHGRLAAYGALAARPPVTLHVRSAEAARLGALLRENRELDVLDFAPDQPQGELFVRGTELPALSHSVLQVALANDIDIAALAPAEPALGDCLWLRAQRGGA